jgi:hypothetical protein
MDRFKRIHRRLKRVPQGPRKVILRKRHRKKENIDKEDKKVAPISRQ